MREPKFKVGDRVVTDFNGRLTTHTIKAVQRKVSQTGIMYELDPPHHKQYSPALLDEAWLTRM
jgi:hypothetical protein